MMSERIFQAVDMFDRYWRNRRTMSDRYGQKCRILARGTMNAALIEFEDGYKAVVNRWAIRKVKP